MSIGYSQKNFRTETSNDTLFPKVHDCFGEIGTLNTRHIEVKDNVNPAILPAYKVLHALKPKW